MTQAPETDGRSAETVRLLKAADLARSHLRRQGTEMRAPGKKARRTRAALLNAAYESFVANGYRATTVEDIHTAIDVSIGTFYQYFRDKADLITTLVAEAILDSADQLFPDLSALSTRDGPRKIVANYIRHYASTAAFQAVWEEAGHHEESVAQFRRQMGEVIEATLAEQITAGQKAGSVRAAVDAKEAARALAAMVDRYCYLTFAVERRTSAKAVAAATDLVIELWQNALMLDADPDPDSVSGA